MALMPALHIFTALYAAMIGGYFTGSQYAAVHVQLKWNEQRAMWKEVNALAALSWKVQLDICAYEWW